MTIKYILTDLKKFINNKKRLPSQSSKDKDENEYNLSVWLNRTKISYKNNKFNDIRICKWKEFIIDPKYSIYF